MRKLLLIGGILAALLYEAMVLCIGLLWDGYSSASQTVSELAAIGAPTRGLWIVLGTVYDLLMIAFGWGVWKSARGNRPLRIVGASLIVSGIIGPFWPPMHPRGTEFTLTDTLHIVWAMAQLVLMTLAIGFGTAALGVRFRVYSIATLVVLVAFGVLTGMDSPGVAANLPTPRVGIWERINISVFLLWVIVLAVALLRAEAKQRVD